MCQSTGPIAISATNPCHLYDLAVALHAQKALGAYHSGYPKWKLHPPADLPFCSHSFRTLVTYGCLRLPAALRPAPYRLFRWQDRGFDRAVASALRPTDGVWIHAMPGQALATFRRAKALGLRTCLNHASGPVRQQILILSDEFKRAGLSQEKFHGFDHEYFERETEEYALADVHCVASTIVRSQLISENIPAERIWVIPYAANTEIFYPTIERQGKLPHRILYAGQLTLRKGLRILLDSFKAIHSSVDAELHLFGPIGGDFLPFLHELQTTIGVNWHGPVSQRKLADAMRRSTVLVLPSWEEAFGLVVPQALNCGIPCIVSNRVGASDLIRHRVNGSIFLVGDSGTLTQELTWWLSNPSSFVHSPVTWDDAAQKLLGSSIN